jgi:uncharacterized protein (DUF2249 family)
MNSGNPLLINPNTKIKDLLRFNEDLVIHALVELNKNFTKLHNPLLRKLFAGRVTIADACRVGGCSVDAFLLCMKNIGFDTEQETLIEINTQTAVEAGAINKVNALELDVRPILSEGKDPLKIIIQNVGKLNDGQALKLINTFDPIPLYHVLAEKGFTYKTENPAPNTFITWFQKTNDRVKSKETETDKEDLKDFDALLNHFGEETIIRIDVRSLEMPKPMLLIMEKVDQLGSNEALFVNHKKVPVYLLPQLKEKGFEYAIKQIGEGDIHLLIYKQ